MPGNFIPPFTHEGLLPPFYGGDATRPTYKSPYLVDPIAIIERFAFSKKRIEIIRGFMTLRQNLSTLGFRGHQWIGGSFVQNKEEPNDIDVVTFFTDYPAGVTEKQLEDAYLVAPMCTSLFCDSYLIYTGPMSSSDPLDRQSHLFKNLTYWHGLFSHTRNATWKGMLELALNSADDMAVHSDLLDQMEQKI